MTVHDKRSFDADGNPVELPPEPEPKPVLATHDAPPDPVVEKVDELIRDHGEVELTAAQILAAAGSEGLLDSLTVAAADMLKLFAQADHDWTLGFVTATVPASEAITRLSQEGKLPFHLTPDSEGQHHTSLVGMLNAFLTYVGAPGFVGTRLGRDRSTGEVVELRGFEPVFPDRTE
jgi:hypothetical protein